MTLHSPAEIVTDAQIEHVHANANFGHLTKRGVVDQGVLSYAFGFTTGYTMMTILQEHGLLRKGRGYEHSLTKKGFEYLRSMFGGVPLQNIMALRDPTSNTGETY